MLHFLSVLGSKYLFYIQEANKKDKTYLTSCLCECVNFYYEQAQKEYENRKK